MLRRRSLPKSFGDSIHFINRVYAGFVVPLEGRFFRLDFSCGFWWEMRVYGGFLVGGGGFIHLGEAGIRRLVLQGGMRYMGGGLESLRC
jgi:hypothetical protein